MPRPWPKAAPSATHRAAYADAEPAAFWTANLPDRPASPALAERVDADLCIVGGGFTGLWAALHAKADDRSTSVVVLEARTCGFGASGRNGGFVDASLTHGLGNGLARFADEIHELERHGNANFEALIADVGRHGIDCDLETMGSVSVAIDDRQASELETMAAIGREFGYDLEVLDRDAMRAEVDSPLYLGGLWTRSHSALVDPGKLVMGLRDAAVRAGVRIYEDSPVGGLSKRPGGMRVRTFAGTVDAPRVLLGTNAFPPLVGGVRRHVVPVYDYVLVTEPLTTEQLASIGWRNRQGLSDGGNRFHYYRLTADDRILFGGYDAVYRYGGPVRPELDDCDATFGRLSQHFFMTFPQLEGVRFSHRWGGAIDTCSRFSVFFGTRHRGRVAFAAGYTGLGVAATRFGARVALDLLHNRSTDATRLRYVRRKPVMFPPEPARSAVIRLTQSRMAAEDDTGRRGWWLRTLDRLGLGFDS